MTIARLSGLIDEVGLDGVLIDVGGVGYAVLVSSRTRAALPPRGETATLLIETQIREDSVLHYGFIDRAERDWFRLLITVQGVGGKVALNLLSVAEPDRLAGTILAQDRAALTRAEGVGAKLAARLVTELKDRADAWMRGSGGIAGGMRPAALPERTAAEPVQDAVAALIGLQFRPGEAQGAVAAAARRLGAGAASGELVRAALRELDR